MRFLWMLLLAAVAPASVKAGFGKRFSLAVDGHIGAQSLVGVGLGIPGNSVRNIVCVAP